MIPLPAGNSSSQFLFQKAATIIGFLCIFSEFTQVSLWIVVPISVVCYTWVLWLNTSETLTYLLLWRPPMVSLWSDPRPPVSPPLPHDFQGWYSPGFPPISSALLLAPSRLPNLRTSYYWLHPWTFPCLHSHPGWSHPGLVSPLYNSRFYISSPSHALNPRFLIRLPAWITIRCLTNDSNGNCPKWNSWLKPLPHHLLPSSPFQLHFFSSYSDPKPQTSMSSFLLSNLISHPRENPIDSSFKQYLTNSHHLRCYLGLSHHQSLPRLLQ